MLIKGKIKYDVYRPYISVLERAKTNNVRATLIKEKVLVILLSKIFIFFGKTEHKIPNNNNAEFAQTFLLRTSLIVPKLKFCWN